MTTISDKMNFVKDYVYYNFKNLFNPAYNPNQKDYMEVGSRKRFGTDGSINGEYFRSMSDNQYFAVASKSLENEYITWFRPSNKLPENIDFNKYKLLRLEIVKNKGYFVESNQDITINDADYTEINVPIDQLIIPEFKPLPQDISFEALLWYFRK